MTPPRAVIFDLGGTLVEWPDWDEASPRHWTAAHEHMEALRPGLPPGRDAFVTAMCRAEAAHWERVLAEQWSGPPSGLVVEGFRTLGLVPGEGEILAALDGYARSVDGWAEVFPDAVSTLEWVRASGLRIGLLSNTWWAAAWHDADLATHGLAPLIDEVCYTSDLPHSKPHPSVFLGLAQRLGVAPAACVMVGDRPADDIAGALAAGMRGIWKTNGSPRENPMRVVPSATISHLAELPALIERWRKPG